MCTIQMESEEVVDNYYERFTKLNSALTILGAQDSFLKEVFCIRLRKKTKSFNYGHAKTYF
jgi:hypothetical protein